MRVDDRKPNRRMRMSHLNKAESFVPDAERRVQPRFAPPKNAFVQVGTSRGNVLRAKVHDMSALGGTCLAFDDDPDLHEGDSVTVSYGELLNEGEVRHTSYKYGQHLVGVRWLSNATLLAVACDSASLPGIRSEPIRPK
jgi:hypothetical protein